MVNINQMKAEMLCNKIDCMLQENNQILSNYKECKFPHDVRIFMRNNNVINLKQLREMLIDAYIKTLRAFTLGYEIRTKYKLIGGNDPDYFETVKGQITSFYTAAIEMP